MTIDLDAAADFMATTARLLDRHRFDVLFGGADRTRLLDALDAHRNPDGGYGWGLEPDLRSSSSQPGGALHAFEVFEDITPATTSRSVELCDWLASASLPDDGLPFALPFDDVAGSATFWREADSATSSLQITSIVAAIAHRVARHDASVAEHPWLVRATDHCLESISAVDGPVHALVLAFSLQFLDAVYDVDPRAGELIDRLGAQVPAGGSISVEGGTADEFIRPLDMAPDPDRPVRRLFTADVIDADLRRLVDAQQDDGGWPVEFANYSPAATLEWRGNITVRVLTTLRRNGVQLRT